jgi:hypothetical protein
MKNLAGKMKLNYFCALMKAAVAQLVVRQPADPKLRI